MQRNAIQHNTTQSKATIQCNAAQYKTIRHNATQYNTIQHNAMQCSTIQHNTTQCNTNKSTSRQHDTMQHNTTQCNTVQDNTREYNTMQSNATSWTRPSDIAPWARAPARPPLRAGQVGRLKTLPPPTHHSLGILLQLCFWLLNVCQWCWICLLQVTISSRGQ